MRSVGVRELNSIRSNLCHRQVGCFSDFGILSIHGVVDRADDSFICYAFEIGQGCQALFSIALFESTKQHIRGGPAARDTHFLLASKRDYPWRFRRRGERARHARIYVLELFEILRGEVANSPLIIFHLHTLQCFHCPWLTNTRKPVHDCSAYQYVCQCRAFPEHGVSFHWVIRKGFCSSTPQLFITLKQGTCDSFQ